jgi:hypothetical protein
VTTPTDKTLNWPVSRILKMLGLKAPPRAELARHVRTARTNGTSSELGGDWLVDSDDQGRLHLYRWVGRLPK